MKFVLLLCSCAVVSSALELPSLKLLLEQKHKQLTNPGEQSSLKKRTEAQLGKRLWLGSAVDHAVHDVEHAVHDAGHAVHDVGHAVETAPHDVGQAVQDVGHAVQDVGHAVQDAGHAIGDIVG